MTVYETLSIVVQVNSILLATLTFVLSLVVFFNKKK
ncbi:BH2196 [Halalkalibacterium halodurans C-125]|uniref:BH2196 protein n=1 Tax=Halalkalibacterium halodurans (strain ATCC BAA-125 / DSM 18197 / FERM 7344 / JCM 9153 / C-125) TaxID=272558 RepID=Q9KAU0_HALH5|nr:BH2196 [Halalkalibacterium halodurans C-125]